MSVSKGQGGAVYATEEESGQPPPQISITFYTEIIQFLMIFISFNQHRIKSNLIELDLIEIDVFYLIMMYFD